VNVYGYAGNSPTNFSDPTGLDFEFDDGLLFPSDDDDNDGFDFPPPIWAPQPDEQVALNSDPAGPPQQSAGPDNSVCSESDPQIVRDASVNALSHLNPSQNETNNITPLNSNFAKVENPAAVSTQGWTQQPSLHGAGIESPIIPGQSIFVVKMYNDPELGNTIAVVHPTMSWMHFVQAPLFQAGVPVNAGNARAYMSCH
jgi:hypothetical protein